MRWIVIYISTALILLPLDFAFLGTVGKQMFDRNVGDMISSTPRLPPAIIFYLIYLIGIVALVNGVAPADWRHNLVFGAVLGFVCYFTFELTNMSILKHWEWSVVVSDIAWGTTVTAIAATGGGLLASWINDRLGV